MVTPFFVVWGAMDGWRSMASIELPGGRRSARARVNVPLPQPRSAQRMGFVSLRNRGVSMRETASWRVRGKCTTLGPVVGGGAGADSGCIGSGQVPVRLGKKGLIDKVVGCGIVLAAERTKRV